MNKKKKRVFILKFVFLIVFLIIMIIFLSITISRYQSIINLKGNISVALYLINQDYQAIPLNLPAISPREEPYVYTFSVSNNDGVNRTETVLEYDLQLITTTNLPLSYELYINQNYNDNGAINIIQEDIIQEDEYGTYFRKISTPKETFGYKKDEENIYNLVINFPVIYKQLEYQDIIESLEIIVNSSQVID